MRGRGEKPAETSPHRCEEPLGRSNPARSLWLLIASLRSQWRGEAGGNLSPSLRGALATKQSSAFFVASGLLRSARNDGERSAETSPRHCEEPLRRSNPALPSRLLDCFAEPVIGRAFARPVGSQ